MNIWTKCPVWDHTKIHYTPLHGNAHYCTALKSCIFPPPPTAPYGNLLNRGELYLSTSRTVQWTNVWIREQLNYFILGHTVQHDSKHWSPKPWPGRWRRAALHCTALHCTVMHCTVMHCNALHCDALLCSVVQCDAVHYMHIYHARLFPTDDTAPDSWNRFVSSPISCDTVFLSEHWTGAH